MKIVSNSGKGSFKLIKNEIEIGELKYKNWFSETAIAKFKNNTIRITPKNIWISKIDIYKNDNIIGDITYNFKGHIIIRLEKPNGKECSYLMKNKATWKLKFEVFDESKIHQFSLNTSNKWTKLNYDYKVEMGEYNSNVEIEELLIYCGYAANLYLAMISVIL